MTIAVEKPDMHHEHGRCPNCNADLNGGSIWEYFYKKEGDEKKADEIAAMYGADRNKGRWGREIGLSDGDSVRQWQCPDCDHIWPRIRMPSVGFRTVNVKIKDFRVGG